MGYEIWEMHEVVPFLIFCHNSKMKRKECTYEYCSIQTAARGHYCSYTCTDTRLVSPCFQSSIHSLTSMDDHTFDHAVVDDYHTVFIFM